MRKPIRVRLIRLIRLVLERTGYQRMLEQDPNPGSGIAARATSTNWSTRRPMRPSAAKHAGFP